MEQDVELDYLFDAYCVAHGIPDWEQYGVIYDEIRAGLAAGLQAEAEGVQKPYVFHVQLWQDEDGAWTYRLNEGPEGCRHEGMAGSLALAQARAVKTHQWVCMGK
jgi:hypothetical protein